MYNTNKMEKVLLGYIVFVSYNRDDYEIKDIAIDNMTLKEFIHFIKNDEVNCLTFVVTRIFNTTHMIGGGSDKYDDSVYWFISADMAKMRDYKEFFSKYNLK